MTNEMLDRYSPQSRKLLLDETGDRTQWIIKGPDHFPMCWLEGGSSRRSLYMGKWSVGRTGTLKHYFTSV